MVDFKSRWNDAAEFAMDHYVLTGCLITLAPLYLVFRRYRAGGVCRSTARLEGKTVLITGGNVGLGKASAVDLAGRGARVILACRDVSKGNDAADYVRRQTGNGNVVVQQLDLSSFKSIRNFAERINKSEDRLDVLMNNAGVMGCPNILRTEDGFELQFGVNHLGHFLLTNLLLDLLKKSAPSRIVNVSSLAHERGKMKWEDLNHEQNYDPWVVYSQSKLANVLFTKALAKRLAGTGVTTYALHPGVVQTALVRHANASWFFFLAVNRILNFIGKTADQGCQTQIYCSVTPELEKETGLYFSDCKVKTPTKQALNEEDADRLWTTSLELTGLK